VGTVEGPGSEAKSSGGVTPMQSALSTLLRFLFLTILFETVAAFNFGILGAVGAALKTLIASRG